MRCELGFVVGNRKEDEEGPPLHLASEEILAAALRTELDRKKKPGSGGAGHPVEI